MWKDLNSLQPREKMLNKYLISPISRLQAAPIYPNYIK